MNISKIVIRNDDNETKFWEVEREEKKLKYTIFIF